MKQRFRKGNKQVKDRRKSAEHHNLTRQKRFHMATILIIDDQLTSRQILQQLVSSIEENLTVKAFANPVEALKWTESNSFSLVLTDYKMPEMNGYRVH